MPFTPAHAVVAIPFVRSRLVPAAIAVGAMTPDVPLYFRAGPSYALTHSWLGAVVVDIPMAFALMLVWRIILRPAVPQLSPRWFAERWPLPWRNAHSGWWSLWAGRGASASTRTVSCILLIVSLAIGVATHLIWDAFTHEGRWGTILVPQLTEPLGPFLLVKWAQYLSSVLGLLFIAIWGVRWLARRTPVAVDPVLSARSLILIWMSLPASLVAGAIIVAIVTAPELALDALFLQRSGTLGAAIFLVVLAAAALRVRAIVARHARDAPQFAQHSNAT